MQSIRLKDESATLALGARLAGALRLGDVVALTGDLGAGKTTLARGLIMAICDTDEVPSPTYTLVQTYDTDRGELWHCDLYRLDRSDDAWELGLVDAFEEAICLIEWPDRLENLLPNHAKVIDIQFENEGRVAILEGFGDV